MRVSADTTDVTRKLRGVEVSMAGVGRAGDTGQLGINKLQNALASLVVQTTGTNRSLGTLISTLGSFAAGGGIMLGITAGVAALAKTYDLLTASGRKVREEQDKVTQSLIAQARAQRAATLAGLEDLKVIEEVKLQAIQRESGRGWRSVLSGLGTGGMAGLHPTDAAAQINRIADAQLGVTQATKNWTDAWAKANEPIKRAAASVKEAADMTGVLAAEAGKVRAENTKDVRDFWRGYIEQTKAALTLTEQLNAQLNAERPTLLQAFRSVATVPIPEFSMPDVRPLYTKEEFDRLMANADRNATKLSDVISSSAIQGASIIVSALNLGGGGKGSNLGGALGSTAGFALGFGLGGPIGGAVGATIGNIAGSLFGGLFDNSKATRENTAATRALTQTLLYQPAGFKSEPYRYNASDPRPLDNLGRNVRWNASRGGANPLLGT